MRLKGLLYERRPGIFQQERHQLHSRFFLPDLDGLEVILQVVAANSQRVTTA